MPVAPALLAEAAVRGPGRFWQQTRQWPGTGGLELPCSRGGHNGSRGRCPAPSVRKPSRCRVRSRKHSGCKYCSGTSCSETW
eukprot:8122809-Lingulodinium_polyedra.AAC.1